MCKGNRVNQSLKRTDAIAALVDTKRKRTVCQEGCGPTCCQLKTTKNKRIVLSAVQKKEGHKSVELLV